MVGIPMPDEQQLPPGPCRELTVAVHLLYSAAGKPALRSISERIRDRDDLPSTLSHEGVAAVLKGKSARWNNLESLVRVLVEQQRVGQSAPEKVVEEIHALWASADSAPTPDTAAAVTEPPTQATAQTGTPTASSGNTEGAASPSSEEEASATTLEEIRAELVAAQHRISLASRTAVPDFYGVGEHAPQAPERILREAHADIGVMLALAVEAVHARSLGSAVRAAWLLEHVETALIGPGREAPFYYAELTALREVLTGREVDEALAEHSWSSAPADYRARAGVRAAAVHAQLRDPHPQVLEWLLYLQACALLPGARRDAVVGAREHLLSYGIDPTDPVVLAALTIRRYAEEWVPQHRMQGYFVYCGALIGRTGHFVRPDMTTPLAELLDAATPLTGAEAGLLARARGVDHTVLGPVWVAGLVELLAGWLDRISVRVW